MIKIVENQKPLGALCCKSYTCVFIKCILLYICNMFFSLLDFTCCKHIFRLYVHNWFCLRVVIIESCFLYDYVQVRKIFWKWFALFLFIPFRLMLLLYSLPWRQNYDSCGKYRRDCDRPADNLLTCWYILKSQVLIFPKLWWMQCIRHESCIVYFLFNTNR